MQRINYAENNRFLDAKIFSHVPAYVKLYVASMGHKQTSMLMYFIDSRSDTS
jgi:hypothetical protein